MVNENDLFSSRRHFFHFCCINVVWDFDVDFGCFVCSSIYKSCCLGCIENLNFVNKDHNPNTPCREWTNLHHHLMCVIIFLRTIKLWILLLSRSQICQDSLLLLHKWVVGAQYGLIHLCGKIKILNCSMRNGDKYRHAYTNIKPTRQWLQ
jgi:hypothetical protein